jgi:hypothetical protein
VRHKGPVTVFVPHYAMSGGSLVAMAADEIVMDANAVLDGTVRWEEFLREKFQHQRISGPAGEGI